jgi:large subunit ribosomal protein L18
MNKQKKIQIGRERRHKRVRAKIAGTAERPRLSVFRSNNGLYLQLIDDNKGLTIASAHSREIKKKVEGKVALAKELGLLLASKAVAKKVTAAVFDKSFYKFHGRVKAAADGAREGGLKF